MKLASLIFTTRKFPTYRRLRCDACVQRIFAAQGMPESACGTQVSDLSPLAGMKLTQLMCEVTPVSDLSAVARDAARLPDMRQYANFRLVAAQGNASGGSALRRHQGFRPVAAGRDELGLIRFTPKNITKGLDVIRQMKSLKTIGVGAGYTRSPPASSGKIRCWRVRQAPAA